MNFLEKLRFFKWLLFLLMSFFFTSPVIYFYFKTFNKKRVIKKIAGKILYVLALQKSDLIYDFINYLFLQNFIQKIYIKTPKTEILKSKTIHNNKLFYHTCEMKSPSGQLIHLEITYS